MKNIIHILNLIRYKNLLIIILTMYFMRLFIVTPLLNVIGLDPQFGHIDFAILVMATVFIAAAGYAINDYFDRKVDMVNHPDSVVVGAKIPRRNAMTLNNTFNILAILAGFHVSHRIGHFNLGFLFVIISGILWFYSSTYKKWFLVGNLIVALFSAMVPFLVLLYEIPLLNLLPRLSESDNTIISLIFLYISGYSFFAFFTTLAREIIKDIEDIEGDRAYGRKTLPVVTGILASKIIITFIIAVLIAAVTYISWYFFGDLLSMGYSFILITTPFIIVIFLLFRAKTNRDFRMTGNLMKAIMLAGLFYCVLIPFLI